MNIITLEQCESTNALARDASRYHHGDIIVAIAQTAGRGQRGNRWESEAGRNLTFSIVLEPKHIGASEQFMLSEAVALAIADTLQQFAIDSRIKWTNDIYVGDRKICGILIENELLDSHLTRSVVGIGLNVNQTLFSSWIPNPTSMASETGINYNTDEVLKVLAARIEERTAMLDDNLGRGRIENDYHALLYRRDECHRYRLADGRTVEGTIRGVRARGELIVEFDGELHEFLFKQIEFIIP